jgi:ribosomal protein S18 acetylase RimI-like enzyme
VTQPTTRLLDLPAGLTARPLTDGDARDFVDIVIACELREIGEEAREIEDVWSDWARPGFDLRTDSLGVVDDGRLVAVAEVYRGRRADVNVHPAHQGRGIGGALMHWTWVQARRHGSALVGETVPDANEAAVALFEANGYEPLWTSWVLELPAGEPVAASPPPAGVALRQIRLGSEEHAVFEVIEDAFDEWPDRTPSSYEEWAPGVVGRTGFEPWQLLVATAQDAAGNEEVVGAAYLIIAGDEGWVDQLAVRRDHRGRGLARALLAASFDAARARGATRFGLSTDSRTGALGLYERVGMRVRTSFRHWAKRL